LRIAALITILTGALLYTGTASAAPEHQQSLSLSVAVPSTIQALGCCNNVGSGSSTTTLPHLGKVDVSVDYAACGVTACQPDGANQIQVFCTRPNGDTLTISGTGTGGLGSGTGTWAITDGSGQLATWTGSGEWALDVSDLSPATGAGQSATLTLSLRGSLGQDH